MVIEKYYTMTFTRIKLVYDEIAVIPSKKLRYKIAGFVARMMRRIQKRHVKNISIKPREEERDNDVVEISAIKMDIAEMYP